MRLEQADAFLEDFALQALWYVREAGEDVARRFQAAVDARLHLLCERPGLGRVRHFRNPSSRVCVHSQSSGHSNAL